MKFQVLFLVCFSVTRLFSQNVQLHYDFRHSVDPTHQERNFPVLYFEYFKSQSYGSFFIKTEANLIGQKNNIGKYYMQVSQTLKFWKPAVYVHLEYSGGLGIIEPTLNGYYINHAFLLGAAYPFQWKKAWFSTNLCYRYTAFAAPSHDIHYSLYAGKNVWKDKVTLAGTVVTWTANKNHGDAYTEKRSGKRLYVYGDPQIWYNVTKKFSLGSKINLFYHVLTENDRIQVYPTAALKYNF